MKFISCLIFSFFFLSASSQTFTAAGGAIPDGAATATCYPVSVTGIGAVNGAFGLASICVNIIHPYAADVSISIKAPDGSEIVLSDGNGSSGDNYTNTCFTASSTISIDDGIPPFTGNYVPQGLPGILNNGQNANGIWFLCIRDQFAGEIGSLTNFSISFSNSPFPPPLFPSCLNNAPAGDLCTNATPICNLDGYCGNTSGSYNSNPWPELSVAFCGSVENDSYLSFVADNDSIQFNVFVYNSTSDLGIQMAVFDGGCGSGPVNMYSCFSPLVPQTGPTQLLTTGLIPGNTYYLMIDGYAGDVCNYGIEAISGFGLPSVDIVYSDSIACSNSAVALVPTVNGGTTGTWSAAPAGLNINPGTGRIIPNLSNANDYTVTFTANAVGVCSTQVSGTAMISITDPTRFLWTGDVSTAWENPANWSCNIVPNASSNVTINRGTVVVSSNVIIKSLNINTVNTNLTVRTGWNFTVLQ